MLVNTNFRQTPLMNSTQKQASFSARFSSKKCTDVLDSFQEFTPGIKKFVSRLVKKADEHAANMWLINQPQLIEKGAVKNLVLKAKSAPGKKQVFDLKNEMSELAEKAGSNTKVTIKKGWFPSLKNIFSKSKNVFVINKKGKLVDSGSNIKKLQKQYPDFGIVVRGKQKIEKTDPSINKLKITIYPPMAKA